MKEYKILNFGIGGMSCTCCNSIHKGRSMKYTKQVNNRKFRRMSKILLKD